VTENAARAKMMAKKDDFIIVAGVFERVW